MMLWSSGKEHAMDHECPLHGPTTMRDKRRDAYYCQLCGRWIEPVCGDQGCGFCAGRPGRKVKED